MWHKQQHLHLRVHVTLATAGLVDTEELASSAGATLDDHLVVTLSCRYSLLSLVSLSHTHTGGIVSRLSIGGG